MNLRELTKDVWVCRADNRFLGLHLGSSMTVVRLPDGALWVHSPVALDATLKTEIDGLGEVSDIVAPNAYHHLFVSSFAEAYPDAKLHGPSALQGKRPDLRFDQLFEASTDAHHGVMRPFEVPNRMLNETVFLHEPSKTLICADLVENFQSSDHFMTRMYLKMFGIHEKPGLSHPLRWSFWRDKAAARKAIDGILETGVDKIALAHGGPVQANGGEILRETYAWLKA